MSETNLRARAYRLFRRDIGRKVIALFLAIALFGAIDRQVSDEQIIEVKIEYFEGEVAESSLDRVGWVLRVASRNKHQSKIYTLPAVFDQPKVAYFRLRGTKTAVDEMRRKPVVLRYDPTAPGEQLVELSDLRGLEVVEDGHGVSAVEFAKDLTLDVKEELDQQWPLLHFHVQLGPDISQSGWSFQPGADTVEFTPPRVVLRGPKEVLSELKEESSVLFQPMDLGQLGNSVEVDLRLSARLRLRGVSMLSEGDLREFDADYCPVAKIKLTRRMVPLDAEWARFELPVFLRVDVETLDTPDQKHLRAGGRLELEGILVAGVTQPVSRVVQVMVAESEKATFEKLQIDKQEDIRHGTNLICLAGDATLIPGEVPVQVALVSTKIPPNVEIRLVDSAGEASIDEQYETIQWVEESPGGSSGDDESG